MKGGSREAKGQKSTGGGRTWLGKRVTLPPVPSPPPPPHTKICADQKFPGALPGAL